MSQKNWHSNEGQKKYVHINQNKINFTVVITLVSMTYSTDISIMTYILECTYIPKFVTVDIVEFPGTRFLPLPPVPYVLVSISVH